jgi:hypothetical protein
VHGSLEELGEDGQRERVGGDADDIRHRILGSEYTTPYMGAQLIGGE